MSDIAIKVEGLSKRYRIGAHQQAYKTIREKLNDTALAPFRAAKSILGHNGNGNSKSETFWALKDVCFEVKRGEVIGIIGRNGAGKSTLLKILSRITEPTSGYADMHGRIASLLEVGTGFHPELSGRENIFLNGSILGMKRAEINRKFDEIVAFAEINKFIDTPVKHYSSGMYVRLAFAVAAHLEPEILMVDEVLAVGDAAFQRKCLGKMGDVAREGRTVLFVSHNMAAIQRLCQTGIYLEAGGVDASGEIQSVVSRYQTANIHYSAIRSRESIGDGEAKFTSWELVDSSTGSPHSCYSQDHCEFRLALTCKRDVRKARLGFALRDNNDQVIVSVHSLDNGGEEIDLVAGDYQIIWKLRLPIWDGSYRIVAGLGAQIDGQLDLWDANPLVTVLPKRDLHPSGEWRGVLNEDATLEVRETS
jgi:homopolymeric O-antigen transport system ATP-binding protein